MLRDQRFRNPSIVIPTQSRLRSITDFEDKSMVINEEDQQHYQNIFNENIHIQKWMSRKSKVGKIYQSEADNDVTKNCNCYMIQIDDILDVGYRKRASGMVRQRQKQRQRERERQRERQKQKQKQKQKNSPPKNKSPGKENKNNFTNNDRIKENYTKKQFQDNSKVYAKVYCNLINTKTQTYISRTIQFNIIQLQSVKSALFKVNQPNLAMFFHSRQSSQSHIKVRIQLSVVQSTTFDLQQVVQNQEYIGYCDIDPFKGLKTKQKVHIYSQKIGGNLDSTINYTVLVSDTFKVLQKLIPPNCLCSSEQTIAGLAGRRLPNNMAGLHYNVQYTDLNSLKVDIVCADIPDSLINTKLKQCELMFKQFHNIQNPTASLKQVRLGCYFHNGWTSFSESSVKLQDKMQIQRRQMKKSSKHEAVKQIIKIKHFVSEQVPNLPFVFLDQQSILIMQILGKIQVKGDLNIQTITLPICFAYYIVNKASADEKQVRSLFIGDGMNDSNFQVTHKRYEINGKVQFYVHLEHANKMHLSKHLITIHTNKSNTQFDRIMLEKQRMIRENKKLRNINRIKKIQLNQQIPILDTTNFKQGLYKDDLQKLRQQRREKQQLLGYLKKKVQEMCPIQDEKEPNDQQVDMYLESRKKFMDRALSNQYFNSVFYKAALQKISNKDPLINYNQDAIKIHPFSLFQQPGSVNLYQSGQVPTQIIKTELLQKNYCYAIFINWVSLIPISEDKRLPRKFTFYTNFFKTPNLKSCFCSINELTGQIQVLEDQQSSKKQNQEQKGKQNEQKQKDKVKTQEEKIAKDNRTKTKKIFYIQIGPDRKAKNNEEIFIQFISYLFHGQLQIKIIDSISGIQFGQCFFRLKDLIRMRRNQVVVCKQLVVKKQGQSKAKLKMEIKVIRKQASYDENLYQNAIATPQLQALTMPPQARQLQRIAQYKKNKMGDKQSFKKIQKMFNQQLMKQQIYIKASRMKYQLVKLEVVNRKNFNQSYKISINDPDKPFLANEELAVVNKSLFAKLCQTRWWKYLNSLDQNKYNHILIPGDSNDFQLTPGQTGTIVLFYCTERKFQGDFIKNSNTKLYQAPTNHNQQNKKVQIDNKELLRMYNHRRCINLSLVNTSNNMLQSMYKINIVPETDYPIVNYKYVRKSNSKLIVQIPYLPRSDYVVYIDDPTVISTLNEHQGIVALDCFSGNDGQCRRFNVSMLSPFPENRLLINYHFQMWGAHQIYVESKLWKSQQLLIDLHTSICQKKGSDYILALSQDQKVINVRDKNPIKVNQKQAKTIIRVILTLTNLGTNHYELNIVSPSDYSIIYRYTLKVQTCEPDISQKLTLRIKLTDKLLQQLFGFRNQLSKKQKFRILTTHPHLLWPTQDTIEVEAKTQKKIKIKINAQQVLETENIVLTMMADNISFNYLFVLQLDAQL